MTKKEKNTQSLTLNENWLLSGSKHIYVIKELDQQGNAKTLGYTRTRNEADLLIYDTGIKLFNERTEYRAKKDKYMVTYSYQVQEGSTRFVLHERSLGYLYNGHKIDRFTITFEQIYRAYNRIFAIDELENMESEICEEPVTKEKFGFIEAEEETGANGADNERESCDEESDETDNDSDDTEIDEQEQPEESANVNAMDVKTTRAKTTDVKPTFKIRNNWF